ncbi:MAG: U32 family peptidase C-terminal domain-containing protein, partial [Clostridia bacterium]|nr:U32 family peptidase C-terminal domain-containing protein [Clostridia bacterium]
FWHSAGVKRIVLARELTLENIKAVRENTPPELEIECFVHGAMCVSYSGRCLLSHYYINRNANDGSCAQPCRWKYYMYEEKRECDKIEAVQDDTGTYVFSSKDMCMIEHIPELLDAGIDSLKIEGRMKSAYYTAAVTNAYRMALDDYFAGKPFNKDYLTEVESVSHREYCTGFYFNSPQENANIVNNNEYLKDRAYLCTVSDYDSEKGMALCLQRNKMSVGDAVQILSPGKVGRDAVINELYDVDGNPIESTPHAKMEFYLKAEGLKKGDIIRGK